MAEIRKEQVFINLNGENVYVGEAEVRDDEDGTPRVISFTPKSEEDLLAARLDGEAL
jgi:hypothetical protein